MGKKKTASAIAGSLAALQEEGNKLVALGSYQEALQKYAAALAAASSDSSDVTRKAALRSNRSLCCLKLGNAELAHAEALQCKELRPEWPKAYYRMAAASEVLGKLGEARLALCEGRRLAPTDTEILAALEALRLRIFPGAALHLGEALDTLEDFNQSPGEVLAAVTQIKGLLQQSNGKQSKEDRTIYLQTFRDGCGPATVFRRQNAMGDHWREECENGTMSILSQIVQLTPQLEAELVVLNQRAHLREEGHDGSAICADDHGGLASAKVPAPAAPRRQTGSKKKRSQVRKLGAACDFGELEGEEEEEEVEDREEEAPKDRLQPTALLEKTRGVEHAEKERGGEEEKEVESRRAKLRAEVEAKLRAAKEAQRQEEQALASAVSPLLPTEVLDDTAGEPRGGDSRDASAWIERHWPQLAPTLPSGACTRALVEHLRQPQLARVPAADCLLAQWLFVVQIRREHKVLWSTSMGVGHAVGWDAPRTSGPSRGHAVYERADVVESGDIRRLGVAGTVAALSAASAAGLPPGSDTGPAANLLASVAAVHLQSARVAVLPAALVLGSGCPEPAAEPVPAPLRVSVGLGARDAGGVAMPRSDGGPGRKQYAPGSLEVRVGLGFAGPGGAQVAGPGASTGGAMLLAACLEASAAWAIGGVE